MLPMMLAKKILELSEQELTKLLRELEMSEREVYNTLIEKLEDF